MTLACNYVRHSAMPLWTMVLAWQPDALTAEMTITDVTRGLDGRCAVTLRNRGQTNDDSDGLYRRDRLQLRSTALTDDGCGYTLWWTASWRLAHEDISDSS